MNVIEKFKEYIKNIKKEDKIAVLYHANCADGLCSCILLNNGIERVLKRKVDHNIHYTVFEITEEIIKFFKKENIKKAIFVDLSLYAKEEMISKASNFVDILLIDHHDHKNDLNSEKITFLHSTLVNNKIKDSDYPASKLVYDLFFEITNMNDLDWLACLGLISDMGYEQWKDFVNRTMEKYKIKFNDKIFSSDFGIASSNISISKRFNDNIQEVFDIVYKAESYKEILTNKFLIAYKLKANEEIKYWINNSKNAEFYKDLIIYEIKPKYAIGSTLSTILSREYFKGKTIVIISDLGSDTLKLNARNQVDTIRTNDLLIESIKGLRNSYGGGHAPASGGTIMNKDLELFKKKLKKTYDKLS